MKTQHRCPGGDALDGIHTIPDDGSDTKTPALQNGVMDEPSVHFETSEPSGSSVWKSEMQGTFAKAYKAGVKIAFGSDNGVFPHALSGHEFVYMVEAGMLEMEAIQAATVNAADLLRISDKLGSVEVGKLADLVAVEGNPLENIELMTDVKFVVVYKNEFALEAK